MIEHLRTSHSMRKEFLRSCGLAGVQLALSEGGGSVGERRRPLLVDTEDWSLVAEAIPRIFEKRETAAAEILRHLVHLLKRDAGIEKVNKTLAGDQFQEFLRHVLTCLGNRWNQSEGPESPSVLGAYFELSEQLMPFPQSPRLDLLWERTYESARVGVSNEGELTLKSSIDSIVSLIDLVDILERNEPRYLRQIGFPQNTTEMAKLFIEKARTRVPPDLSNTWRVHVGSEEVLLGRLIKITTWLARHFPEIGPDLACLLKTLKSEHARTKRHLEKLERRLYRNYGASSRKGKKLIKLPKGSSDSDWYQHDNPLNIRELFQDL